MANENTTSELISNLDKVIVNIDKLDKLLLKATKFSNLIVSFKPFDIVMQKVEFNFEQILKNAAELANLKKNGNAVKGKFKTTYERMNKMLAKILAIDTKNISAQEIEFRTKLVTQIKKYMGQIGIWQKKF